MHSTCSDQLLARYAEIVEAQLGLRYPSERWGDLARGFDSAARDLGFPDTGSFLSRLLVVPAEGRETAALARQLTIGETYFFRDENQFTILETDVLPGLIRSRRATERRLRIWSAGCASGEEPYSVAILLTRLIPDLADWNVTILATDVNSQFLGKASQGAYTDWSFRSAPSWLKQRYFHPNKEGLFQLLPRIKKMVTFSYLNLAEDAYPTLLSNTNAIDLIICRNVLMYFTPAMAQKVIHKFHRSLAEGGWLLVAPSETSHILFSSFSTVEFSGAFLYRKATDNEPLPSFYPFDSSLDSILEHHAEPETVPENAHCSAVNIHPPEMVEQPNNAYDEALTLYNDGRYSDATDKLTSLLSDSLVVDARSLTLLTRAYANAGKLREALTCCEQAIAADRLVPSLYYLRATILHEQNQLEEAAASLKQALYLDPDFVLGHFALGNHALTRGLHKQARKHFDNALRVLARHSPEEVLPESDGITAGRLAEIIQSATTWSLQHGQEQHSL